MNFRNQNWHPNQIDLFFCGEERTFKVDIGAMLRIENDTGEPIQKVITALAINQSWKILWAKSVMINALESGGMEPKAIRDLFNAHQEGKPLSWFSTYAQAVAKVALVGYADETTKARQETADPN